MGNAPTTDISIPSATDVQAAPTAGLLAGKVAFVTGAGCGIGAAAARLFAREGARVMLAARTEAQLKSITEEIRASAAPRTTCGATCGLGERPGPPSTGRGAARQARRGLQQRRDERATGPDGPGPRGRLRPRL
ncbi:hypothetical protein HEK616_65290 [Streptomyces nigrescens]|uniref:SDR family NAD(P)-dependent oxidoreductase n=1 Tax=Streptomyces nigrescens TaxID=1920 RepID=A0ABN6R3P0_STRNI|nr:hypothetical protein HEK616_65290 [Streptomyces nigrescens]